MYSGMIEKKKACKFCSLELAGSAWFVLLCMLWSYDNTVVWKYSLLFFYVAFSISNCGRGGEDRVHGNSNSHGAKQG